MEFCSVNMDAWYYRISRACDVIKWHKGDVKTIWIRSSVTYTNVVHSTWPSRAMWWKHAPTFNTWHKKEKKKVTLHMLTRGAIQGCWLTSLMVYINDKFCDTRERQETIRSAFSTTNIRSLGFWDIRDCVTYGGWYYRVQGVQVPYKVMEFCEAPNEVTWSFEVYTTSLMVFSVTCTICKGSKLEVSKCHIR